MHVHNTLLNKWIGHRTLAQLHRTLSFMTPKALQHCDNMYYATRLDIATHTEAFFLLLERYMHDMCQWLSPSSCVQCRESLHIQICIHILAHMAYTLYTTLWIYTPSFSTLHTQFKSCPKTLICATLTEAYKLWIIMFGVGQPWDLLTAWPKKRALAATHPSQCQPTL